MDLGGVLGKKKKTKKNRLRVSARTSAIVAHISSITIHLITTMGYPDGMGVGLILSLKRKERKGKGMEGKGSERKGMNRI